MLEHIFYVCVAWGGVLIGFALYHLIVREPINRPPSFEQEMAELNARLARIPRKGR